MSGLWGKDGEWGKLGMMEINKMTFEETKEIFKKSIDTTDTMNQAIENLIQSIYLKGYNDASCDELDFVQPHKKVPVNLEVCKMRDATQEEREEVEQYIDSIAETCEDCISRQDAVNACRNGWGYDDETIEHIVGNILELPPVTPAKKVGHWEYVQYDGNPNTGNWHCSECRAIVNYKPTYNWEKKPYYKFCPNCGAKMEGF